MQILVTGGAGYIGSHTCLDLLAAGHQVIIYDNFSNASRLVIERLESIAGQPLTVIEGDILDEKKLDDVFRGNKIEAVIHFAGLKAVGESVEKPLTYYHNNISGTVNLCQVMQKHQVYQLVFSSSATVYGVDNKSPFTEDMKTGATNPYGWTKQMIEQILRDLAVADDRWRIALLRYFNPLGAHQSGLIGEDPKGIPNNLMPYVTQVAVGKLEKLQVYGDDYDTPDGTGVRDYIHVLDLAKGHVKALDYLMSHQGAVAVNLGTGIGYSVIDIVKAFEEANQLTIPYQVVGRRSGDIGSAYSNPNLAKKLFGWEAEYDLVAMCRDSWRWQKNNPNGYEN